MIPLGLFDDESSAVAAYHAAMAKMNGVGASGNQVSQAQAAAAAMAPTPSVPRPLEQADQPPVVKVVASAPTTTAKAEVLGTGVGMASAAAADLLKQGGGVNLPLQVQLLANAAAASRSLLGSGLGSAGMAATEAKAGGASPAVKTLSNTLASIWPQAAPESAALPTINLQALQALQQQQQQPKQEPSPAATREGSGSANGAGAATSILPQFGQIGGAPTLQQVQLLNSLKNHPDLTSMAIHFQQKDSNNQGAKPL